MQFLTIPVPLNCFPLHWDTMQKIPKHGKGKNIEDTWQMQQNGNMILKSNI